MPLVPSASPSTNPMLTSLFSGSHLAASTTTPHLLQNTTKGIPTMSLHHIRKLIISGSTSMKSQLFTSHCLHLPMPPLPNSASTTKAISPTLGNHTGLSVLRRTVRIPIMCTGLALALHHMAASPMSSFVLSLTDFHLQNPTTIPRKAA